MPLLVDAGRSQIFTHRATAAAGWWTVAGKTCVGAYAAKGAVSLAASYANLANAAVPLTTTSAPTFDPATGWAFVGASSQYLATGITWAPGYSLLIRISDAVAEVGTVRLLSANVDGFSLIPNFFLTRWMIGATNNDYGSGIAAGTLGVAGNQAYRNGTAETGTLAGVMGTGTLDIGRRTDGTRYWSGKIQALAIYSDTLTAGQMATVSAAVAAL